MKEPFSITNCCLRIGIGVVVVVISATGTFSAVEPSRGADSEISELAPKGEALTATTQSAKATN
jgi:hypothetical protein